jgi:enamine deaminase RidA (YjgF/YER057c/UK114 family)
MHVGRLLLLAVLAAAVPHVAGARDYIKRDDAQPRAYSPAVITEGGKIVWLGGQSTTVSLDGRKLAGDFEGQVRDVFARLEKTLQQAGGKLSDMVTMTVFITDARNGTRLTEIRHELFGDNFPGSALITITALANPASMVEIQGVAVIGDK